MVTVRLLVAIKDKTKIKDKTSQYIDDLKKHQDFEAHCHI